MYTIHQLIQDDYKSISNHLDCDFFAVWADTRCLIDIYPLEINVGPNKGAKMDQDCPQQAMMITAFPLMVFIPQDAPNFAELPIRFERFFNSVGITVAKSNELKSLTQVPRKLPTAKVQQFLLEENVIKVALVGYGAKLPRDSFTHFQNRFTITAGTQAYDIGLNVSCDDIVLFNPAPGNRNSVFPMIAWEGKNAGSIRTTVREDGDFMGCTVKFYAHVMHFVKNFWPKMPLPKIFKTVRSQKSKIVQYLLYAERNPIGGFRAEIRYRGDKTFQLAASEIPPRLLNPETYNLSYFIVNKALYLNQIWLLLFHLDRNNFFNKDDRKKLSAEDFTVWKDLMNAIGWNDGHRNTISNYLRSRDPVWISGDFSRAEFEQYRARLSGEEYSTPRIVAQASNADDNVDANVGDVKMADENHDVVMGDPNDVVDDVVMGYANDALMGDTNEGQVDNNEQGAILMGEHDAEDMEPEDRNEHLIQENNAIRAALLIDIRTFCVVKKHPNPRCQRVCYRLMGGRSRHGGSVGPSFRTKGDLYESVANEFGKNWRRFIAFSHAPLPGSDV